MKLPYGAVELMRYIIYLIGLLYISPLLNKVTKNKKFIKSVHRVLGTSIISLTAILIVLILFAQLGF